MLLCCVEQHHQPHDCGSGGPDVGPRAAHLPSGQFARPHLSDTAADGCVDRSHAFGGPLDEERRS